MKGSPGYVAAVASNAREAVRKAVLAENTASYFAGEAGPRADADKALSEALSFITELERLAGK